MKKMKVVLIEPMKRARIVEIDHTLEAMQKIVRGYIETFRLDEDVTIVCNEEAKIEGLPANRGVFYEGELIEVICGTFFICSAPLDTAEFGSLTDNQAQHFAEMFMAPEYFLRTKKGIVVVQDK